MSAIPSTQQRKWAPGEQAAAGAGGRAVEQAIKDGAKLRCGGKKYEGRKGYYYQPTVLTDCRQETDIMQKEIFGPVLPDRHIQASGRSH